MSWTRVVHNEHGDPDPATLPPDGAFVAFYRNQPDFDIHTLVAGHVTRQTVNRPGFAAPGRPLSYESAVLRDIRYTRVVEEPDDAPTEVGDYWKIIEP